MSQEDAYKRRVQNPVYSSRKLSAIGNKLVKLDDIDASSAHENKLGLKILSEEKMEKVKNWDSVGKQQKAVSPIRGILKNHKHISGSTSGSNIQDGTEESQCDVQVPSSDMHVGFSARDFVFGPKKRHSFDETAFNLCSNSLASSFGKEKTSGCDEESGNLEESINDDNIAFDTDKRRKLCPTVESKQFSNSMGQVSVQSFLKPCANQEKSESLSKMAFCDNNLHWFDRGNTTTLHVSPHADISRSLSAFQAEQIKYQACESEAFSYTRRFIDHLGEPTFQSATVHSNASTRTYLEPSTSYSASFNEGNERPGFPLHTYGDDDNNGLALGGRSWSGMFSTDMIDNSFLLPGWGKGRNNSMEQNFFGLPLNSHGELINVSSSGKVGMNEPETSCTLRGSLSGLPVNNVQQNSLEYLSIGKRHVPKTLQDRVNPFQHFPDRLGVRELHGKDRADTYQHNFDSCSNHHVQPRDLEFNLMRNPFMGQNQLDKVSNNKEYGIVSAKGTPGLVAPSSSQPTMRLMGKDVPIGRSSKEKQQFVGGVLWAEEESKRRHYSVDAAKDNSLLGRCPTQNWVSGSQLHIPTENVLQSAKIQSNQAVQSTLLMNGPNSEFLGNHISQDGSLGVRRNASSNLHPITQTPTSCAIYNRALDGLPEQFISGAKPQGLCFQSQALPTPCNFSQSALSNGELNEWKKHHRITNSAFGFPFLDSVVEEQANAPWFKRSYRSVPPWLSGSTHERLPGSSSSNSFRQSTWRNNFTIPSVNHSADVCPPNSVTFHCPRKTLLCPTIAQPPHASITPVTKPPAAIKSGCRNIFKVTNRAKLDDVHAKDHHPCTNSRKRPAANFVGPAKPNRLLDIDVQKNLRNMTVLAQETSSANFQQNTRADELDVQVGARRKCQIEAQNQNPRSYIGFDSFDLDGVVISGRIKLSPGAKHP